MNLMFVSQALPNIWFKGLLMNRRLCFCGSGRADLFILFLLSFGKYKNKLCMVNLLTNWAVLYYLMLNVGKKRLKSMSIISINILYWSIYNYNNDAFESNQVLNKLFYVYLIVLFCFKIYYHSTLLQSGNMTDLLVCQCCFSFSPF